jgi:hypothetical protein
MLGLESDQGRSQLEIPRRDSAVYGVADIRQLLG